MGTSEISQAQSARRSAPRRVFSVDEANRTLPLVRRIVTDIVNEYRTLADDLAARERRADADASVERSELDASARARVQRLNELIEELHGIGCELKDWETGLVDFRAQRSGEPVYLCWRLGEESISHWHELQIGVAGRRPVDDAFDACAAPAPATSRGRSRHQT